MSAPTANAAKTRRWMKWKPKARITADWGGIEPTEPSKLGSAGFEGANSSQSTIIPGLSLEGSSWPASSLEIAGAAFRLDGEKVLVSYPNDERRNEPAEPTSLLRAQRAEVGAYLKARSTIPPIPKGVHLVACEPKAAPVRLDLCSVVFDVRKFIEAELQALDSRLNNPWTIRGGFSVPQILDRLREVGVEVEVDVKGEKP